MMVAVLSIGLPWKPHALEVKAKEGCGMRLREPYAYDYLR
jgi:hypothetical protein